MSFSNIITTVLFDIDRTLFDHDRSLRAGIQAVQECCLALKFRDTDELISAYRTHLKRFEVSIDKDLHDGRELGPAELCGFYVNIFFLVLNCEDLILLSRETYEDLYMQAYSRCRYAIPNARETLLELKRKGYAVGIISRQDRAREKDILRTLGLMDHINILVTEAGFEDEVHDLPDIFAYTTDKLGCRPWDAAVVTHDGEFVQEAIGAMCNAIWYNPDDTSVSGKYVYNRTGLRVLKDFRHLPQLLNLGDRLNWRVSIEQDDESQQGAGLPEGWSTPEPPSWSPLTSADGTPASA